MPTPMRSNVCIAGRPIQSVERYANTSTPALKSYSSTHNNACTFILFYGSSFVPVAIVQRVLQRPRSRDGQPQSLHLVLGHLQLSLRVELHVLQRLQEGGGACIVEGARGGKQTTRRWRRESAGRARLFGQVGGHFKFSSDFKRERRQEKGGA